MSQVINPAVPRAAKAPLGTRFARSFRKYWPYYVLLLPAIAYFIIFCYCSVAYIAGWLVMKLLVPRYMPVKA